MNKPDPGRTCKICGRPSEAEVCARCFLSYDYRAYKREPDPEPEKTPPAAFAQENDAAAQSGDGMEFPRPSGGWERGSYAPSDDGGDSADTGGPFKFSIASWFSRLPRFGGLGNP